MNDIEYLEQISPEIRTWLYNARPVGQSNHWFVDFGRKRFHAISYANGVDNNAGYALRLGTVVADQLAKTNRKIEFVTSDASEYNRIWLFNGYGTLLNNSSASSFSLRGGTSFVLPQKSLIDATFWAMDWCRKNSEPYVFSVILFTTTPIIR
jgi:hypothetical protein